MQLLVLTTIATVAVVELAAHWRRKIRELRLRLKAKQDELAQLEHTLVETGQKLRKSAHDLNNVFGIVIGYSSLPVDELCEKDLGEIVAAAQRGAELSKQISATVKRDYAVVSTQAS